MLSEGSLKGEDSDPGLWLHERECRSGLGSSLERGSDVPLPCSGTPRMIVRRDGSIDFRVLAGRVAAYGVVVVTALALGALIAFVGS